MKSDDCPRRFCGAIELKRGVIIAGPVHKVTVIAPITETSVPMILAKPPYSSFSTLTKMKSWSELGVVWLDFLSCWNHVNERLLIKSLIPKNDGKQKCEAWYKVKNCCGFCSRSICNSCIPNYLHQESGNNWLIRNNNIDHNNNNYNKRIRFLVLKVSDYKQSFEKNGC